MKDVHTEHCCVEHGCKYGDFDCSVTTGKLTQSYPCEQCCEELDELKENAQWHIDNGSIDFLIRSYEEKLKLLIDMKNHNRRTPIFHDD